MQATAADAAVAWYVCLSVCVAYTHALYTTREPILSRLFLGVGLDATETLYPWRPTPYDGRRCELLPNYSRRLFYFECVICGFVRVYGTVAVDIACRFHARCCRAAEVHYCSNWVHASKLQFMILR